MNSMLRAALGALVHVLAPGAETSGDSAGSAASATGSAEPTATADRTFAEQQYLAPAWEHGHVPLSVDLFGALGRLLDARAPGDVRDAPETRGQDSG
ncbi:MULTISPECIES: hypothetical protein [Oerskovia]|uniref:Uncharacterized protein n=1 Tax=Oerskovia rustica TaxID=2762237 RepID=A0ABR8RMD5_9CELL|nr:hypothetical protein [Oerskovia rustica]MBD7948949.1 hypothetical protein [Oerskovia rustica]